MTFQQWRDELEARLQKHLNSLKQKVSLPGVSRQSSRPTKVYLAGKISKNDWRHDVVGRELRDSASSITEWREIRSVPICDGLEYVGPFFISDDHGCGHGAGSHGASGDCGGANRPLREEILAKSLAGIRACDIFVVWAEKDFPTAYGTIAEIGMARALHKRIVIIHAHGTKDTLWDLWFPLNCGEIIVAETPEEGILKLFANNATPVAVQTGWDDVEF